MKRFLSVLVALSILFSAVVVPYVFDISAEKIDKGYVNENGDYVSTPIGFEKADDVIAVDKAPIRFEYYNKNDDAYKGYADVRDGKFVLVGRRPKNATTDTDSKVVTKGVTQQDLTDFNLKYVYNAQGDGWNLDGVFFHTNSETPSSAISVIVAGRKFRTSGNNTTKPIICISKDIELTDAIIDGASYDSASKVYTHNNGVFTQSDITKGKDYYIEIEVKENTVKVYVYATNATKPSKPTISYTDNAVGSTSGDIAFTARTGGCTVSKITIKDTANNKTLCNKYSPTFYNSATFTHYASGLMSAFLTTGHVAQTVQGYKLYSTSDVLGTNLPVTSSAVKPPFNGYTENYNLSFDYIHDVAGGVSEVWLNSDDTQSGTNLNLNITDSKLELFAGANSIGSVNNALTVGTVYTVYVEKTALSVSVWVYEKGTQKPQTPTLNVALANTVKKGAVYFHTKNGGFTVNNIKLSANDGYFDIRNSKFVVSGRTTSSEDAIVLTKGITGKALTDFTLEYIFNTPEVRYSRNFVTLHTDLNNPHPSNMFVFTMNGGSVKSKDGGYATPSIIRGATSNKGDFVTDADFHINANTDYKVKIKLTRADKKIEAWVWKLGETQPDTPTLTFTHNDIATSSGDIALGNRGNPSIISDITITDDANNKAICQNYSPVIYNSDNNVITSEIASLKTSGTVTYQDNGYRINSKSSFDSTTRPVATDRLPMQNIYGNFELSVDYRSNSDDGTNKVLFNSSGVSGSGFSLTLSKDKVALYDSGALLDDAAFNMITGKSYSIDISRLDYSVNVYIYIKGAEKPTAATLTYSDKYPLGKGDIYFYTANGDFTIGAIDLEITDISSDSNVVTDKHVVYGNPPITIEKAGCAGLAENSPFYEYGGGIVGIQNGRVVLSAHTEAIDGINNGKPQSLWVTTKGLTGEKLKDYTLKYSYIPAANAWNVDALILRANNSDNPNKDKGYIFGVQGSSYQQAFDGKSIIWIQKDTSRQISTDLSALDSSKAVYADFELETGTEYIIEASVAGSTVDVYMYKATEAKPTAPTISYTDAKGSYTSGDIAFAARDEGYSIADITLVDVTNNKTIADTYTPSIYNNQKLDFTEMGGGKIKDGKVSGTTYNTGNVSVINGKYKLSSENGVEKTTYKNTFVKTNSLVYKGGKYFTNFELCFVASFTDEQKNVLDVYFNNNVYTGEYKLALDKENGKVNLYKNAELLTSAEYIFKNGFDYQVIVSKSGGKIDIYVYKAGTEKPSPWLTYTDSQPLPEGTIFFGTHRGEFILGDIALKVNDAALAGNPYYTLDFENGMEDALLIDGTSELVKESENTYLRVTKDDDRDGKSLLVFGPQDVENFTLNIDLRITENTNPRWFYFDVRHHTSGDSLTDGYDTQIFQKGSSIAATSEVLGYKTNNHKLGLSGPTPAEDVPNPSHDYKCGVHADGDWHRISLVSDGNLITLYIDGRQVVSAKDPEELYKSGGFAIYTWGINYEIDNIRIYSEPYYALENDIINLGPTGLLFEKDFEGDDADKDGLNQSYGHTDKTVVMQEANGNHFLRVIGKRDNDANDLTGTNAVSRIHFGSDYVRNFDFSARVRFKSAFNANWSWLTVAVRSDFANYSNRAVWMNISPRGSSVSLKRDDLGYGSTSNIVATTGNVATSTSQTAYMPDDNRDNGIPLDGRWHNIKVIGRGYTFTLYIDGKEIITYTDHDKTYERGAVYLYGYGINYDLDDIRLTNNEPYTPATEAVNTVVYENANGFTLDNNKVSDKLLKSSGAKDSNLGSFEWQFDYKAGSSAWGRTTFMFHTTKDAAITNSGKNFANNKNVFGLTIAGTAINSKTGKESITGGIKNNAITCLTPNLDVMAQKELIPVSVETAEDTTQTSITPVKDSYLTLEATSSLKAIDISQWTTINIRLVANKVYLCVWQTNNKQETFRRTMFTLPVDAINALKKGDFVVSNGDNKVDIRNITIRNEDLYFKSSEK